VKRVAEAYPPEVFMNKLLCLLAVLPLALMRAPNPAEEKDQRQSVYRTEVVKRGALARTVQALGTVEPENVVDVGAQVTGQIIKFGADPRDKDKTIDFGTIVDAGTILAQLDPAIYEAKVAQARAALEKAVVTLKLRQVEMAQVEQEWIRVRRLGERALSKEEIDITKTKLEVARTRVELEKPAVKEAEAHLKEAELNLAYTIIRSPIRGVIIDRRVNVGQTVAARLDTPSLFLIATDLSKLRVWASVNEADIGTIQPGQTVRFTVKPYPDQVFQGKVSQLRLNAAMTKGVVTYTVVVQVDNPGGKLLPYLTADVHFVVGHAREALLVPNAAVRWKPDPAQVAPGSREFFSRWQAELPDRRGGRALVWVKEKDQLRPIEVRLGASDGLATEVVGGDLPEGTAVVVGTSSQ
jgi:HlyD family secretion protein